MDWKFSIRSLITNEKRKILFRDSTTELIKNAFLDVCGLTV